MSRRLGVIPSRLWSREELEAAWAEWDKSLRRLYLYWRELALEPDADEDERLRVGSFAAEKVRAFVERVGYRPGKDDFGALVRRELAKKFAETERRSA